MSAYLKDEKFCAASTGVGNPRKRRKRGRGRYRMDFSGEKEHISYYVSLNSSLTRKGHNYEYFFRLVNVLSLGLFLIIFSSQSFADSYRIEFDGFVERIIHPENETLLKVSEQAQTNGIILIKDTTDDKDYVEGTASGGRYWDNSVLELQIKGDLSSIFTGGSLYMSSEQADISSRRSNGVCVGEPNPCSATGSPVLTTIEGQSNTRSYLPNTYWLYQPGVGVSDDRSFSDALTTVVENATADSSKLFLFYSATDSEKEDLKFVVKINSIKKEKL